MPELGVLKGSARQSSAGRPVRVDLFRKPACRRPRVTIRPVDLLQSGIPRGRANLGRASQSRRAADCLGDPAKASPKIARDLVQALRRSATSCQSRFDGHPGRNIGFSVAVKPVGEGLDSPFAGNSTLAGANGQAGGDPRSFGFVAGSGVRRWSGM